MELQQLNIFNYLDELPVVGERVRTPYGQIRIIGVRNTYTENDLMLFTDKRHYAYGMQIDEFLKMLKGEIKQFSLRAEQS